MNYRFFVMVSQRALYRRRRNPLANKRLNQISASGAVTPAAAASAALVAARSQCAAVGIHCGRNRIRTG